LLGRFAAFLLTYSAAQGLGGILFNSARLPPDLRRAVFWRLEHSMICTTMLAVGIFAVLSWDATFPNRRDVLVLAPLPVKTRTLFFAKVSAACAVLGVTVLSLNALQSLTWGVLHFAPGGFLSLPRSFLAYWLTMFAAGAFVFCVLLGVQGLA